MDKELKVNRVDLLDGCNDHIEWIDKTINTINATTGGVLTGEMMKALAMLAQAKATTFVAMSNMT